MKIECSYFTNGLINLFRFEYELLANFLVEKRGYDPSLKLRDFELDQDFICKVQFSYSE